MGGKPPKPPRSGFNGGEGADSAAQPPATKKPPRGGFALLCFSPSGGGAHTNPRGVCIVSDTKALCIPLAGPEKPVKIRLSSPIKQEKPMSYNIMRTGKIKDRAAITSAASHNFRIRQQGNIDATRTPLNRVLWNPMEVNLKRADALQKAITGRYEALGAKERKNSVLAQEFVVSASPEFSRVNPRSGGFVGRSSVKVYEKRVWR